MVADVKEVYDLYDKTGRGDISYEHVGEVIRCLGYNPTQGELMKTLSNPNEKDMQNKKVSFEQFLPVLKEIINNDVEVSQEEFIEGLRVFDRGEPEGNISAA